MRNSTPNLSLPGIDACVVPDCGMPLRSEHTCYCRSHHQRFMWFGSMTDEVSTLIRFGRHITLGDGGCWVWTGSVKPNGYGQFHVTGGLANTHAHRASWELHRGEIPAGLQIDHLCRNIRCVNPDHLEPVPHKVNQARRAAHYRQQATDTR